MSRIVALMLFMAAAVTGFGQCRCVREPAGPERPENLLMENEWIRLRFDLQAPGARCREYTIKPLDKNLILEMKPWPYKPKGRERSVGYFVERSADFRALNIGKPGDEWPMYFTYTTKIVTNTPSRVVVEFAGTPNIYGVNNAEKASIYRQMTYTKRITLESGSPAVRVEHIYHNFGTDVNITPWPCQWINPSVPVMYYLPGKDGVHWAAAPHQKASGGAGLNAPGAGWVGFIQQTDKIGGAMLADDPAMLDGMEVWGPGMDRSEGNMGFIYNRFVTDMKEDLHIGYRFMPLVGLPRLDGLDLSMACAIDLESDTSLKLPGPDWTGGTQSSLPISMSGAGNRPRHWLTGNAVNPGDEIRARIHLLAWSNQAVKLTASLRALSDETHVELGSVDMPLEQLKAQAWPLAFKAPAAGTYVLEASVAAAGTGQVISSFERPFVIQKESKPYRRMIPGPRKGQPFFTRTIGGIAGPEQSAVEAEAARSVAGKGPYIFQFASQDVPTPWPGMKLVNPMMSYEAGRGYGWENGKTPAPLQPLAAGAAFTKESPDFLGWHGVWGGSNCEFTADTKNGEYAVAVLNNDIRGWMPLKPRHATISVGTNLVYERTVAGQALVEEYYQGMNIILRRDRDMWREYIEPLLHTIRFSARVTDGKLRMRFEGMPLNCVLIYPAEEEKQLVRVLQAIAAERKESNPWWQNEESKAGKPGVALSAEDVQRGYRIVALSALSSDRGFGTADQGLLLGEPLREDLERKFDFVGARDMWLSWRTGIQPLKDLEGCRLDLGELKGPYGSIIPQECVRVGVWKYLPTPTPSGYSLERVLIRMPQEAEAFKRIPIDKGFNRYYWTVVRIPPDAKPGLYQGTCVFTADNAVPAKIPVTIRVYPFRLERPQFYWWTYMYVPYPGCTLERFLDDLHEHGVTVIRTRDRSNGKWGLRMWVEDAFNPTGAQFFGADEIDRVARARGYTFQYSVPYSAVPKDVTRLIAANSPGWEAALEQAEKDVEKTYRGWREEFEKSNLKIPWIISLVGEGTESPEDGIWHKATIRAARRAGLPIASYQWRLAWREPLGADMQFLAPSVDAPYFSEEGRKLRRQRRMQGAYYYAATRSQIGFDLHRHDLQGATNEGYGERYKEGNRCLNELDGYYWNWCHCYPSLYGPAPCFSWSWEAFREGSTDYSFLYALKTACDKAGATGKPGAKEASEAGLRLIEDTLKALENRPNNQYAHDEARRVFAEKTAELMNQYGIE